MKRGMPSGAQTPDGIIFLLALIFSKSSTAISPSPWGSLGIYIPLKEAYALAASKPSRKKAAPRFAEQRKTYFSDFTAFLQPAHPDVATVADVRRPHCEEYVSYLVEHGRFIKDVKYGIPARRGTKEVSYRREYGLSPKTIRVIVGVCRWVFRRVAEDAGIVVDPWEGIQLPEPAPVALHLKTSGGAADQFDRHE